MLIYPLAYAGGALTILSPCVLPVLPLCSPVLTNSFAAAASGGHWVMQLNQGPRYLAMAIFLILGISLLFPSIAEQLTRPLVRIGGHLQGQPSAEAGIGIYIGRTFEIEFLDSAVEAFAFTFG
jgi:hypothetical protein